ncbi:signal peptidase complex subunit 3-like [Uranotaenia lowii]|uniref:signal peptidase complex subunit 3-like n=1 Tax=Uranotaenia lowii TaxID=190385 RepID=UPI002478DE06|nr:signal peptidase complex subunit 3-like [Uranotaenia lowii]
MDHNTACFGVFVYTTIDGTFCCLASTFFNDYGTPTRINTVKVLVKNVPDFTASREKNDLGVLTFDLKVVQLEREAAIHNPSLTPAIIRKPIIRGIVQPELILDERTSQYCFWKQQQGRLG